MLHSYNFKGRDFEISDRDSQKQKVYDAEFIAFKDLDTTIGEQTLKEVQAYANHITNSKTWDRIRRDHGRVNGNPRNVIMDECKDAHSATAYPGIWRIRCPKSMRNKHIMLHELAHILVGSGVGHHWPFCRAFIDLVAVFISGPAAKRLEKELKRKKARTRPPMVYTEEYKLILAERGRKALAAYHAKKRAEGEK